MYEINQIQQHILIETGKFEALKNEDNISTLMCNLLIPKHRIYQ